MRRVWLALLPLIIPCAPTLQSLPDQAREEITTRTFAYPYYEIFSCVVSCIAIIVSLVVWNRQHKVWNRQHKLQKEANDLQRATSELAKKQLEILLRQEKGKNQARLSLDLIRDGKTFRFYITNKSDVDARDVEMELLLKDTKDNPLISSEYSEKFPAKRLSPGSSISLIAALHLRSPSAFNALLKWTNPDGSRIEEETFVAL